MAGCISNGSTFIRMAHICCMTRIAEDPKIHMEMREKLFEVGDLGNIRVEQDWRKGIL